MVWILLSGLPLGESSDHTFQSLWVSDRYWWRKSSLETGLSPATGLTKEFSRHVAIPQLNTIFFLTGTWQGALVPDKLSQSFLWQAIISHQPELGNHFPKAVAVWRAVEVKPPRLPQLLCHCARKSRSQIYSGSCMQSRKQLPKWNKQNKKINICGTQDDHGLLNRFPSADLWQLPGLRCYFSKHPPFIVSALEKILLSWFMVF